MNQSSSWGIKGSLNELSKNNNPSNTSYSNYLTTNISTTYSAPNRWDETPRKHYHSNEKIPNNARYNYSFNEFRNNHLRPYYRNSFTSYDSSWKSGNKYKKRNLSSDEIVTDYRKQEPSTICYIQPS